MSDSKLLYNVPLQVVLPPLTESAVDCNNINKLDMDKKLSKELNLTTATSDSNNSHTAATTASPASCNNPKEKTSGPNEETDGSISMTSSEKQEWSVTLYDVDRKGNVSEEDLARLVTMLYKAAGSSITVPPPQLLQQQGSSAGGTKKIKLRLSVAPDNNQTKVYIQKPHSCPTTPLNTNTLSAPGGSVGCNNGGPTASAATPQQTNASFHNRHVGSKREKKQHRLRQHGGEGVNFVPGNQETGTTRLGHSHRKKNKKRHSRSASADKNRRLEGRAAEEVCGPVQENMDRRQYYKDLVGIENDTLQSLDYVDEKAAHNRTAPPGLLGASTQENVLKNREQTVYLPPEKGTKGADKKSKRYSKQVHFEGNGGNNDKNGRHAHRHTSTSCCRQSSKSQNGSRSRPKSCPAPGGGGGGTVGYPGLRVQDYLLSKNQFPVDNFEQELEDGLGGLNVHFTASTPAKGGAGGPFTTPPTRHHHLDFSSPAALSLNCAADNNNKIMEGISPHHLRRHRNREHEYNRSMKQVAEWIQRQHTTWSPSTTTTSPDLTTTAAAAATTQQPNDGGSPLTTEPPVVLKHEHHHIHEHHHHYHFYHYYET